MAKKYAKRFYKSLAWKKCRASYILSTLDGMCEHCKEEPGYIVDHIVEITPENINNPGITSNHDNLKYLCLPCHNTKTFGKSVLIREDVMFDENGEKITSPFKKNSNVSS
ncbi:HNH endonuclease [Bacillus pseudomycoides]|uniref:HNH endonuclease signature motif containing protein n=1 Tax=Bacillus TaxID=1386 RepID=UPI0005351D42|nr:MULTISPECIES: HNH endonuclease signature motif containing protein [Bacillus]MCX2828343.1 HNH endonuclease signature motif containing protein [Bacillus sp. DHT2]MDR4915069.1 HNH endonuclease signature motif containing protein [Bacillus pseudomycoides]PDX99403.1 HNH endonuclease [Bacillus pseudomycoides]PEE04212.1 HNH endonuclease [Bacillus pseudomycoides]PEK83208.1 HNH endonuclease [Bacillus pseudomycoides]